MIICKLNAVGCRGTRKRITMCGAFQLFTTTTSSSLDSGPTEPTEPNETLDQYDNTGQGGDETVDEVTGNITEADQEDDTGSKNDTSDAQIEAGIGFIEGNISMSIQSLCLQFMQFMLFDTDRDLFISLEEVETRRNETLEEKNNTDQSLDTDINQTEEQGEDTADKGSTADKNKEDQQVSQDGGNDGQDESKDTQESGPAGNLADQGEKEEDEAKEEENKDDQAEKASSDVDNGAGEEEAKGDNENAQTSGTQSLNNNTDNNNNNNKSESNAEDIAMEMMNSSAILALDIDNDTLVSLAEFLRHKSDFLDVGYLQACSREAIGITGQLVSGKGRTQQA